MAKKKKKQPPPTSLGPSGDLPSTTSAPPGGEPTEKTAAGSVIGGGMAGSDRSAKPDQKEKLTSPGPAVAGKRDSPLSEKVTPAPGFRKYEPLSEESPSPPDDPRGKKSRPKSAPILFGLPRWAIISLLVAGPVLFLILFARHFYQSGRERGISEGIRQAKAEAAREGVAWPAQTEAELNTAMSALRQGDTAAALRRLQDLESSTSPIASLSYLVALAAMQNGENDLAEKKARESIDKLERISDSLALLSVLESEKAAAPGLGTEALLRQAILADAANPYPHFELATLLRYRGRKEEAMAEIEAAQVRLNPMDSHLVMAVTLALMKIEETPEDELPLVPPDTDDPARVFPAAFVAMRRGDFAQAATLLEKCRQVLAPDVFDYLIYDPALRLFSDRRELKPFFGE